MPTRSRIAAPSRSSRTGAAPRPAPGPSLPQVRAPWPLFWRTSRARGSSRARCCCCRQRDVSRRVVRLFLRWRMRGSGAHPDPVAARADIAAPGRGRCRRATRRRAHHPPDTPRARPSSRVRRDPVHRGRRRCPPRRPPLRATAATHALNRWRSSGGVVAPIPAAPYPDDRYQTKMIWWDRRDFIRHAEPGQVAKILTEGEQLTREVHRRGDLAVTWRDVV